ncbi:hypothetical protein mRhiFer1_010094 [Rhinolophus ferrumequinum]|uniref:Uncharacterized protein n=1 Tax=Rhinolophus ferrumequinum TaxID=59479 RepID=A0A7J7XPA0_RHIFE|nr:hypothetical protein mRhiFer1_010094 [Rhinolophus ferrumequinum]
MGVRTRAPLRKTQVETRAQWKAKPVFHFCTANRARVVPIYAVGGSDRTRSWPRWPEHTRAPVDVQPWPLRAYLLLPGGCCFRGLPWSPPEVPELPGSPPCPSRLNAAQLPTQGPHFAPTTRGHCGRGLFPPKAPSARSDQEPAGAGRVDRKRLLPRGQTPRCVTDLHHQDTGEGAAWTAPLPAKVLTASPRRRLGNHLMKRMIWGVFSINQKKCTLK